MQQLTVELTVESLVTKFNLQPHPEGGFYAETYRGDTTVEASYGTRSSSTAIYFLITPGSVSRLHRIAADEVWHFYLGGPMTVVEISEDGNKKETILGQNIMANEKVQYTVKAGTWFGSYPCDASDFSFVGCTVAPGFDFQDFELASRTVLVKQFPQHKDAIERLTIGLP
tara:strand:+ start:91 stop:600 length:510 start_codon:yes stop_codon:yes gene_type:complete